MKNITVTIPDDVYREARVRAASSGTSVSALVGAYLRSLGGRSAEFTRLEQKQEQILGEIKRFRGADRIDRDAVHHRAIR